MKTLNWKKHGRVYSPLHNSTHTWRKEFAQAPSTLILKDRIRVYYSTRSAIEKHGQYTSYSSFLDVSLDDPSKVIYNHDEPILPLGAIGSFDEHGIYPFSAIEHEGSVLGYYAGWHRCTSVPFNTAIGVCKSNDDGKTFKKLGTGPILSYSLEEPFVISGPKIRYFNNTFYLFYIAGNEWILDNGKPEPVYKIRFATSSDGLKWDKANKSIIVDKLDKYEAQASPDVFFQNGQYHMVFCYRHGTDYRNGERGYRLGYAYSNDLITWHRNDDKLNFKLTSDDETNENLANFDNESVSYPHIFHANGKTFMYYLGNGVGKTGFGLAELLGSF
ncbi:hypothetical protein N9L48_00975 [Psychrosphaera sp.]|nr:hypothetical protein [Psychrosphaera sp.]